MNSETSMNPKGWKYNPSKWSQRIPIVILAVVGGGITVYLTLYQYGLAPNWEPFFDDGSAKVLHPWLSEVLPVRDAAIGAFGYFLDAATGVIGGKERWRTMPWMVIIFGLAVGPLGGVSVLFIILQPYTAARFVRCLLHLMHGDGGHFGLDDRPCHG